jgi:hypothetical protein
MNQLLAELEAEGKSYFYLTDDPQPNVYTFDSAATMRANLLAEVAVNQLSAYTIYYGTK